MISNLFFAITVRPSFIWVLFHKLAVFIIHDTTITTESYKFFPEQILQCFYHIFFRVRDLINSTIVSYILAKLFAS